MHFVDVAISSYADQILLIKQISLSLMPTLTSQLSILLQLLKQGETILRLVKEILMALLQTMLFLLPQRMACLD